MKFAIRFVIRITCFAILQGLIIWFILSGQLIWAAVFLSVILVLAAYAIIDSERSTVVRTKALIDLNANLEREIAQRRLVENQMREHNKALEDAKTAAWNIAEEAAQSKKEILEAEERMRLIIESSPNGILVVDTSGQIKLANRAIESIFGYSRQEILNQLVEILIPQELHHKHEIDRKHYFEHAEHRPMGKVRDLYGLTKDGKKVPLEIGLSPLYIKGELHSLASIVDISERKKSEATIQSLRKQKEDELRESEERFRNAFDYSALGLCLVSLDGKKWLKINKAMHEMFGYTKEDMLSIDFETILFPEDFTVYAERARKLVAGELPFFHMQVRCRHSNGMLMWVILGVAIIRDEKGLPLYLLFQIQDVTGLKNQEQLLEQQKAALERSNHELEQFAYVTSHDLQEPLRMVTSYVQLLAKKYHRQLDETAQEYIHYAVEGAQRMCQLINDLLTYSRVQTQTEVFEEISMEDVYQEAMENLKAAIVEKNVEVTKDPLPLICADKMQMVQLFQNLIGNALKFQREEPIRIHISAKENEDEWTFSVSDNGIGIEKQYLHKIFVIFKRLHTNVQYPGTGIGLAICKKIVERHQGRIWVESEVGVGSTFHFSLAKQRALQPQG